MKNYNHYERAFEAYIHQLGLPCVSTRERRRAVTEENPEMSLKTFDFIVSSRRLHVPTSWNVEGGKDYIQYFRNASPYAPLLQKFQMPENERRFPRMPANGNVVLDPSALSWLVEIKGRRFPSGQKSLQYWRNWTASDDLVSLARWENLFGVGFHGLFVFVYDVCGTRYPVEEWRLFEYEGKRYAFFGVPLVIYDDRCRRLSERWQTVTMSTIDFRKFAVPLDLLFGCRADV
ncbi:MAG: HYExAFE family protein [Planctomycetia bacterium]|nr:HYExAFE family protein [Planctomycetia bacterium]